MATVPGCTEKDSIEDEHQIHVLDAPDRDAVDPIDTIVALDLIS